MGSGYGIIGRVIIGLRPDRIVHFDGFLVSPDTAFATIKRILALTS